MAIFPTPRLLPMGDGALTVQFGDEVSREANARVLGFIGELESERARGALPGVSEWIPAYAAATLIVNDESESTARERDAALLALAERAQPRYAAGRHWRLPACFDAEFAPDLPGLAAARALPEEEVIRLLTSTRFTVYMLGFLPGLPYMGGLPPALEVPRLASPRSAVPARSIAVAGLMCTVYPWVSPGGWHLVGRTPLPMFDAASQSPALLAAGDEVSWAPVSRAEFDALEKEHAAHLSEQDRRRWLQTATGAPR
jgi:KipI family sensor histidine kinase inhibitor